MATAALEQMIDSLVGAVGVQQAWAAVSNAAPEVLPAEKKSDVYKELMARSLERVAGAVRDKGVSPEAMCDLKYALEMAMSLPEMEKGIAAEHEKRSAPPAAPAAPATTEPAAKDDMATADLAAAGGIKNPEQEKKPPEIPAKKTAETPPAEATAKSTDPWKGVLDLAPPPSGRMAGRHVRA